MSGTSWPAADRPRPQSAAARRDIIASLRGGDTAPARAGLTDPDERVRATALILLAEAGLLDPLAAAAAASDASGFVRRSAAEAAVRCSSIKLADLLADTDHQVVEMACWAAGERARSDNVTQLCAIARSHPDSLCREAAVAALGAIGDTEGLETILAAMTDKATVRRRAVLALAPFDDPRVDAALADAVTDRDWQVRQAAEDLA